MRDYIADHHINAISLSTQIGMALINQYPEMELRYCVIAGEKMLPCAKTGIRLINGYGPTEFTDLSSYHVVDQEKDTGNIPIGRPVANTWSFICDGYGNLLPQGMPGELCLAGPQMGEGYWRKEKETREKFVPCTFLKDKAALSGQNLDAGDREGDFPSELKMYRTGDLARYNEDGELEFLGRIDNQVKLRGYRIELGEIEACASVYPGLAQVAAEVCNDQLVLYYTESSQAEEAAGTSRERTGNGPVDAHALIDQEDLRVYLA